MQDLNIIQNNLHEDSKEYTSIQEPFMTSLENVRSFKTDLMIESLNNSTENNMFFKRQ